MNLSIHHGTSSTTIHQNCHDYCRSYVMDCRSYVIADLDIAFGTVRWLDHHLRSLQRRILMHAVPLDAVPLEVVVVETLVVVLAVQVAVEAAVEPPGAVIVVSAAIVEATVVVSIFGAERHAVVVFPMRRQ